MGLGNVLILILLFRIIISLPRRTYNLLCNCCMPLPKNDDDIQNNSSAITILIVLGSGGHTSEMLTFLQGFNHSQLKSVAFFIAKTDDHSQKKAQAWISKRKNTKQIKVTFHKITRAREVGQSWCSTMFTTVRGLFETILQYCRIRPDVVLCNGPGTCLPIVYCGFVGKVFGFSSKTRVVFVESFARVKSLSLTGWLVYPVVDRFVVQWQQLQEKWPRGTEFIGKIC